MAAVADVADVTAHAAHRCRRRPAPAQQQPVVDVSAWMLMAAVRLHVRAVTLYRLTAASAAANKRG